MYETNNSMRFLRELLNISEDYQDSFKNDILLDIYSLGQSRFFLTPYEEIRSIRWHYNRAIWFLRRSGTHMCFPYMTEETYKDYRRYNTRMFLLEKENHWDHQVSYRIVEVPIENDSDIYKWLTSDGWKENREEDTSYYMNTRRQDGKKRR